jgi:hypothetical protein
LELGTFCTTVIAGAGKMGSRRICAANNSPMPKKISLRDARGTLVLGSFAVREGMITVTASDGRTKTAKIDEGMLRHETLAKMLLLQMHREGVIQGPAM